MPRPKKCRKICAIPKCCGFGPMTNKTDNKNGAGELIAKDLAAGGSMADKTMANKSAYEAQRDLSNANAFNAANNDVKCAANVGVAQEPSTTGAIEMTLDEYEAIRLIDYLGYTQETCAVQMGVARTTVQSVYNDARKKLARVLIEGKYLYIKGGNYTVCPRAESCDNKKGCQHESCSFKK